MTFSPLGGTSPKARQSRLNTRFRNLSHYQRRRDGRKTAGSAATAVGAVRIVDTANGNLRFAFGSNTLFADDTLIFSGGGTPFIVGVAYTNPDTTGSTGTTLYYLDATTNSFYSTTAPNDGSITSTQVALGIDVPTSDVGFDVQLFGTSLAYPSPNDNFYSVTVGAEWLAVPSQTERLSRVQSVSLVAGKRYCASAQRAPARVLREGRTDEFCIRHFEFPIQYPSPVGPTAALFSKK